MDEDQPSILYIDTAYLTSLVWERGHEHFFHARHSGGLFKRVWGCHPIADVVGKKGRKIDFIRFSDKQVVIEGVAEELNLPRFLLPLNFLYSQAKLVRTLAKVIRDNDISLIISTDPYYGGILGMILRRMTGRKLALRIYANYDELYHATGALAMPRLLPFRWLEQLVGRFVLKRADLVTGGNQNNLDWGIINGATCPTGISTNARYVEQWHLDDPATRPPPEPVLEKFGIPTGRPMMLFIGRQIALKHPDDAIRAMAVAIGKHPEAIGILAGTGAMRPQLEALVEELGMKGKIFFAGHVTQRDLSRLTPHSITLSPLTGMALIECGLAASAIVAYDRDWQTEFIEDGVSGFVVPFRDHQAMGERAAQLIGDAALARRFSAAIRAHALVLADRERIAAMDRQLYGSLLGLEAPAQRQDPAEARQAEPQPQA
ncbi:MAG: glycosyltransferase family 4 protein [Alphaproteobacteria bacterium]|nr:MAG: glycosyltransferase family 4 protein [Alphaproteobacteria bacterium]